MMQLDNAALLEYDIDMAALSPLIQAKLREKAASYEDCMSVARRLTWLAYGTVNAPAPRSDIRNALEAEFGPIQTNNTVCLICRERIPFEAFADAQRGKAAIETAHASPRQHNPGNVGFAHRPCNIAQGDKGLDGFYEWIAQILANVEAQKGTAA
ncbi:hypothetical protein FVA74_08405 [Salinibacterium sp. dk2585]|nr:MULTISPECIES: hypothetical protein [unclassified Salinibacterium]QEE61596.1 hypothetical protein FVA74_08405 [Salinibacterium sp. dk2585]TXK52318.1 hypothetical protein FVP63_13350 [Salinibacterium sp. dk5596]